MEQRVAHGLGLALGVGLVAALSAVACSGTPTRVSTSPTITASTGNLARSTTTSPEPSTTAAVVPSTVVSSSTVVTTAPTTAPTTVIPGQPADPAAATAAIGVAYATLINVNATPTELQNSVQTMQNPGGLSTWQQAKNLMTGASVVVYRVRFVSAVRATVVFQFFYNGGPSPIFPKPMDGGAVYASGHWQIDAATACSLAVGAGYSCPGSPAQPPTTDTVPAGMTVPTNPPATDTVPVTSPSS